MNKADYFGHRERVRKKYLSKGIDSLNDYEIIELLLFYSIPVKDTKPIAKNLIKKYGSIKNIFANIKSTDFKSIKGIGEKTFLLFSLIKDLHKIIEHDKLVREVKVIKSVEDVIDFCKNILWDLDIEQFCSLFLNSKNEIIKFEVIEQGTVNEAYVYYRRLFEKAFYYNSTAIILIHNHPSGKVNPSNEDINITKEIINLASNLGITVHDHIIISEDNYFSFKENQLI